MRYVTEPISKTTLNRQFFAPRFGIGDHGSIGDLKGIIMTIIMNETERSGLNL